jgi:hypothetical protein
MYRLVPGCEPGEALWDKWAHSTVALMYCIEGAILPGLVPTTALFNKAARYLPPHISIADEDKIPFLLAMLKQCDDIFRTAGGQVEREKQWLFKQAQDLQQQIKRTVKLAEQASRDNMHKALLAEAALREYSCLEQVAQELQRHNELMDWRTEGLQQQVQEQQGRSGQQGSVQQHSPLPHSAVQLRDRWLSPALAVGEAARLLLTISEVYDNPQGKKHVRSV